MGVYWHFSGSSRNKPVTLFILIKFTINSSVIRFPASTVHKSRGNYSNYKNSFKSEITTF